MISVSRSKGNVGCVILVAEHLKVLLVNVKQLPYIGFGQLRKEVPLSFLPWVNIFIEVSEEIDKTQFIV